MSPDKNRLKKLVSGVGPDAPVIRHKSGGMESKPAALFTRSFPWKAVYDVAKIVQHGADKYAPNNWRGIPRESHLNHALIHLVAWILGDNQDDHFGHFMTRVLMAGCMPDDRPYDNVELGCVKCANDWTPPKEHDGECTKSDPVGPEMLDLDEPGAPKIDWRAVAKEEGED